MASTLETHKLYGAAGRRNVSTLHELRGLAEFGEWSDEGAEVHRKTVGYFHLFHSSQAWRFAGVKSDGKTHDDELIRLAFGEGNAGVFPVTVLYYSPGIGEWAGRKKALPKSRFMPRTVVDEGAVASLIADSKLPIANGLLVVGEVKTEREVAMIGALEGAVSYCSDAELAGRLALVRPGAIYLAGEPTPMRLLGLVPVIVNALDEVLLIGCWYGYPWFPVSTTAVELIVGCPDWAGRSGVWGKVVRDASRRGVLELVPAVTQATCRAEPGREAVVTALSRQVARGDGCDKSQQSTASLYFAMPLRTPVVSLEALRGMAGGVVVSLTGAHQQQEVIECLLECRRRWTGPMAVVAWRLSIPAVRIVAAHLGIGYFVANEKGLDDSQSLTADGEEGFEGLNFCPACVEHCSWLVWAAESPFAKTLLVKPGAELDGFSAAELLGHVGADAPIVRSECGFAFDGRSKRVAELRLALHRHLKSQSVGPSMLCQMMLGKSPMVRLSAVPPLLPKIGLPPVWVRAGQSMTVFFSGDVLSEEELDEKCAGLRWKGAVLGMATGDDAGLPGLLGTLWQAVHLAETDWVAVVDGLLKPLPGATFPDVSEASLVMVCPAKQFFLEGTDVVTASRMDAPGFLVNREWMKATLGRIVAEGETAVQAAIEREAVRTGNAIRVETLLDYGWQY